MFSASLSHFLRHILSAEGVKPDPRKVEAIADMPTPSNKTDLQHFLSMVNYLGKFIPRLSDETAPLQELLKKDVQFLMQKLQMERFNDCNDLLQQCPFSSIMI